MRVHACVFVCECVCLYVCVCVCVCVYLYIYFRTYDFTEKSIPGYST